MIYASKESRRTQIAFLILSSAIFNSFSNLLYLDNSRAEISACKRNVKLFHLLGSSSLPVNSPIMYCNLSVLKLPTILVLLLNLWPAVYISRLFTHFSLFFPALGPESHIFFVPFGGWQVCTRPLNALHSLSFCMVWHILSKGQFNWGNKKQ